jgi:hypothetical protein
MVEYNPSGKPENSANKKLFVADVFRSAGIILRFTYDCIRIGGHGDEKTKID